MMFKILGSLTMNAGASLSGSSIFQLTEMHKNFFDQHIVIDGDLTQEAEMFYKKHNDFLKGISYPWNDDYKSRYEMISSIAGEDSLILYMDDDELPSLSLLNFIDQLKHFDKEIYQIPCVLYIRENKKFYPVEPCPPSSYYEGLWTKKVLYKSKGTHFLAAGSHVWPSRGIKPVTYLPYPYYHLKTLASFVYNDCWQAFLHPQGQQYSPIEEAQFKLGLMFSKIQNTKEFKKATVDGTWNPVLQKFAWEKRWEVSRPVSRLAWTYFLLLGHPMPEKDENFSWENVKVHVLGEEKMKLFEKNKAEGNFIEI